MNELTIEDLIHVNPHPNPKLWNPDYTLKEGIRDKLLQLMEEICPNAQDLYEDFWLLGSNTQHFWSPHSDLDIGLIGTHRIEWGKPFMFEGMRVDYKNADVSNGFGRFGIAAGLYSFLNEEWITPRRTMKAPTAEDIEGAKVIYENAKIEILKAKYGEAQVFKEKRTPPEDYKPDEYLSELLKQPQLTFKNLIGLRARIYQEHDNYAFHPIVLAVKLIIKNGYFEHWTGRQIPGQQRTLAGLDLNDIINRT